MADPNLTRRVQLGKDSTLELKTVRLSGAGVTAPDRRDFADELAALANSRGGTAVLGVDDRTRRVHGIPLDDIELRLMMGAAA